MYIAIVCFPGCDVMNFEIKPFLYMTKKSIQKLKYLENEKSFYDKKKNSSYLKSFQLPKIVSGLRVRLLVKNNVFLHPFLFRLLDNIYMTLVCVLSFKSEN